MAMNRNNILAGITAFGMGLSALGAGTETIMTWNFDTSDNPAIGEPGAANPVPATGTANIQYGVGLGYFPGTVVDPDVPLNFGSATGVWDIGGAGTGVKMDIDLYPATPTTKLDYKVVVRQFASTAPQVGFPYSPNVTFSIPGYQLVGTPVEEESTANGVWIKSTYSWQQLSVAGPITLTMGADSGKGLLLDSLAFSVTGDLVPIPEPSVGQLGAVAALMLGIGPFRRTKANA